VGSSLVVRLAANTCEAAAAQAAVEIGIELLHGVLGEPYVERPVINGAIKCLDIIPDDLLQDRRLRPAPLVFGTAPMLTEGGRR
jgi:hypothetical protein